MNLFIYFSLPFNFSLKYFYQRCVQSGSGWIQQSTPKGDPESKLVKPYAVYRHTDRYFLYSKRSENILPILELDLNQLIGYTFGSSCELIARRMGLHCPQMLFNSLYFFLLCSIYPNLRVQLWNFSRQKFAHRYSIGSAPFLLSTIIWRIY